MQNCNYQSTNTNWKCRSCFAVPLKSISSLLLQSNSLILFLFSIFPDFDQHNLIAIVTSNNKHINRVLVRRWISDFGKKDDAMAEAHQAVAFSFSITHEGWDINYDREVLNLVWSSGLRSWKKRVARLSNGIRNGVYPAHLQSLWIVISIAAALHFSGRRTPLDIVNRIRPLLPG